MPAPPTASAPSYFVRLEQNPRFVRWATKGPHVRYAILRTNIHPGQGPLTLAYVSPDGVCEEFGSYYSDLDNDGVSGELRALRALRRIRSKHRATLRDMGITHTPLCGSLSIHYVRFGHYPREGVCTWLCRERSLPRKRTPCATPRHRSERRRYVPAQHLRLARGGA